jgi:hypothetical protein
MCIIEIEECLYLGTGEYYITLTRHMDQNYILFFVIILKLPHPFLILLHTKSSLLTNNHVSNFSLLCPSTSKYYSAENSRGSDSFSPLIFLPCTLYFPHPFPTPLNWRNGISWDFHVRCRHDGRANTQPDRAEAKRKWTMPHSARPVCNKPHSRWRLSVPSRRNKSFKR